MVLLSDIFPIELALEIGGRMAPQTAKLLPTFLVPGGLFLIVPIDILRWAGLWNFSQDFINIPFLGILFPIAYFLAYLIGISIYEFSYYRFQYLHRYLRELVLDHELKKTKKREIFDNLLSHLDISKTQHNLDKSSKARKLLDDLKHYNRFLLPILSPTGAASRVQGWSKNFELKAKSNNKNNIAYSYDVFNHVRTMNYIYAGDNWIGRIEYSWGIFRLALASKWATFALFVYCAVVTAGYVFYLLVNMNLMVFQQKLLVKDTLLYFIAAFLFYILSVALNAQSWERARIFSRDCVIGFLSLSYHFKNKEE